MFGFRTCTVSRCLYKVCLSNYCKMHYIYITIMILFFYIYFSIFEIFYKMLHLCFLGFFLVLYMALSISRRYSIIYIYMCIYKYFGFFFNKAGALINRFEYLRYPEIGYAETFRSEHFRSVSSYRSESVSRLISYVLFEMLYLISFCG